MKSPEIPLNRPPQTRSQLDYIRAVLDARALQGNGSMTKACVELIASVAGTRHAGLTHSCTAALEIAALVLDIKPGDEVIMPSFAFVSIANAVVLRGATPVFVDIRPDTLNMDEGAITAAITAKTRAIFVVHYAGVAAEMDAINAIGRQYNLPVIEDAAQAYLSSYKGKPLGGLSDMGCFSFHETKNIVSGEGGAFVTNDAKIADRVHILCDKGTNRQAFLNGQVDKYTWVDIGSSYYPAEIVAALLRAQLEAAQALTDQRLGYWGRYFSAFHELEVRGLVRRPVVPEHCGHNGHLFHLLLPTTEARDALMNNLRGDGIVAPFHYIPLHNSPAGLLHGRAGGALRVTEDVAGRLLRLPLYADMGEAVDRVIDRVGHHIGL